MLMYVNEEKYYVVEVEEFKKAIHHLYSTHIKTENKLETKMTIDRLIRLGYKPCGNYDKQKYEKYGNHIYFEMFHSLNKKTFKIE